MDAAGFLPYVTVLGTLFVLIGFVVLIWKEAVSHHFSTISFFCFVVGAGLIVGSLFAEKNLPPVPAPVPIQHRPQTEIEKCLLDMKRVFLEDLQKEKISCPMDMQGWPERNCVVKTKSGNALYGKLYDDSEHCYRGDS